MQLELVATIEKIAAQAGKEPDDHPVTVLTLKAALDAASIGKLARFIGQSVTVTIQSSQLEFEDEAVALFGSGGAFASTGRGEDR